MTMSLFDRSLGTMCAVLLLAVVVTGSFGSASRHHESNVATIANVVRHGADLASAHPQCQHAAEHSQDILSSLQGASAPAGFTDAAYAVAADMMRHESGVNPVDPPPRA